MIEMKCILCFEIKFVVEVYAIKALLYDRIPRFPKRSIPFSWHILFFLASVLSFLRSRVPLILLRLTFLALVRGLGHFLLVP